MTYFTEDINLETIDRTMLYQKLLVVCHKRLIVLSSRKQFNTSRIFFRLSKLIADAVMTY